MVQVLQQQDRRPTATLSASERASRSWITTVLHAPKSSRRTSPKRLGGPIATGRRPRHFLSPKAPAQGNDATDLRFLRPGADHGGSVRSEIDPSSIGNRTR